MRTNLQTESEHYIFHFFAGSLAEKEINQIIAKQEKSYSEILDFLNLKNSRKISYYLYSDNKIKGELMGDDGNGNAIWDKFEVHAVYNDQTKCIGAHEDTHLLSLPLGISVKLFREGLAEMMSKTWHNKSHDFWAKKFLASGTVPDFAKILDNDQWDEYDDTIAYPCAGSFCIFLIGEIGKEKFLTLYGALDCDKNLDYNLKKVEEITGMGIEKWQQQWQDQL